MGSDGTVRGYTYDDRDQLIRVRDPNRIIQNWFDAAGRVVRQEVRRSETDTDPYVATVRYVLNDGSITEADFDEGEGVVRYKYNSSHLIASKTFDPESRTRVTFTYEREPTTNALIRITLSCLGPSGPLSRPLPPTPDLEATAQLALIRDVCLTP
jgi:hypothetical protein